MATKRGTLRHLWRWRCSVLLTALLVYVLGEAHLRAPWVTPRLLYATDPDLGTRLDGNQRGFLWLGGMSVRSPAITLNRDGHRAAETDWSRDRIVALGNSEAFGSGVEDDEVWTVILESEIAKAPTRRTVQVVNQAHPGHGPWHHYTAAERLVRQGKASPIMVRVSIEDWNFRSLSRSEIESRAASARIRIGVRKVTRFLPFLYNKIIAQIPSFRGMFRFGGEETSAVISGTAARESTARTMVREHGKWWLAIADVCESNQVPVLFYVVNALGWESNRYLHRHLIETLGTRPNVRVAYLGPREFGIEGLAAFERSDHFRSTFTLRFDPHANPRQHRVIALALAADPEAREFYRAASAEGGR